MSYGFSPYGITPYGLASFTSVSVSGAWAISTHGVHVELTGEPLHLDPFGPGDALNPSSWEVTDITAGRTLTVVQATMNGTTAVDLVTLEPLGDHLNEHAATAVGLFAVDGTPISAPVDADFLGVVQTIDQVDIQRADLRDRDLANPPFQSGRSNGIAGTLVIGSDGDFDTEAGAPLIRKLILRRLNTPRGRFRHLPDYGAAILEKEPLSSGGLIETLRDTEDQVRREPDVRAVRARGSLDRSGTLIIQLQVSAADGTSIDMRVGNRAGRLQEF